MKSTHLLPRYKIWHHFAVLYATRWYSTGKLVRKPGYTTWHQLNHVLFCNSVPKMNEAHRICVELLFPTLCTICLRKLFCTSPQCLSRLCFAIYLYCWSQCSWYTSVCTAFKNNFKYFAKSLRTSYDALVLRCSLCRWPTFYWLHFSKVSKIPYIL